MKQQSTLEGENFMRKTFANWWKIRFFAEKWIACWWYQRMPHPQNFMNSNKISKFTQVFSLKSYPLVSLHVLSETVESASRAVKDPSYSCLLIARFPSRTGYLIGNLFLVSQSSLYKPHLHINNTCRWLSMITVTMYDLWTKNSCTKKRAFEESLQLFE